MAQERIEILFKPVGSKDLIRAVEQLNLATKKLQGTTSKYEKEAKGVVNTQKKVNKEIQRVNATNKNANKGFLKLGGTLSVVRSRLLLYSFAIGTVAAAMRSLMGIFTVTRDFEVLETRLKAMTGSSLKAAKSFDTFNKIAARTPFTLQDITEAGVALQAFGANAEEAINPVADLAAFMGINATEAAQAFGRAFAGGAGAADILRERGVLELVKSFSGVKDLTKLTLPQFRKALISTMQDPMAGIAGQTEELSKTFEGSFSNMKDSLSRLSAEIGNTLSPSIQNVMKRIGGAADALTEFLETPDKFKEGAIAFERRQDKLAKLTLPEIQKKLKDARADLEKYNKSIEDSKQPQIDMSNAVIDMSNSISKENNVLDDGIITIGEVNQLNKDMAVTAQGLGIDVLGLNKLIEEQVKIQLAAINSNISYNDELVGLTGTIEALLEAERRRMEQLENAPPFLVEHQEAIAKLAETTGIYASAINGVGNSYMKLRQTRLDSDKEAELSSANSIKSERRRQKEVDKINKKYEVKQKKLAKEARQIKRAQTVVNTSVAIMEALSAEKPGFPGNIAVATMIGLMGAMQLATIDAQKYATGGMVGGRRHSQGGTMIEAERGEFVVSRRGVDAIGIEALNRINAGQGGGSVNVTFAGNVLSKDFIEDEAIPQIKEAIRRGADIGVG